MISFAAERLMEMEVSAATGVGCASATAQGRRRGVPSMMARPRPKIRPTSDQAYSGKETASAMLYIDTSRHAKKITDDRNKPRLTNLADDVSGSGVGQLWLTIASPCGVLERSARQKSR
jgi:hypothetical protein